MKVNKHSLLGLVFFAGLGLILLATAVLKDWTVFEKKYTPDVFFSSAGGIRAGDTVTVYGMRAGRVKKVEMITEQTPRSMRIKVTLENKKRIPFRPGENYSISIQSSSFLGGKVVAVNPEAAKGGTPYDPKKPLLGKSDANPLQAVADIFTDSSTDIKGILRGLADVADKASSGDNTIGALLHNKKLYDSILNSATRINLIIEDIQAGKGSIGGLIKDPVPYQNLKSALAEIKKSAKALNDRKSLASRIIHDERLGEDTTAMIADLRTLAETVRRGEGTIGKLLMKDEIYGQIQEILGLAKDFVHQAYKGDGLVSMLINNASVGKQFVQIVTDVENITGGLARGEGTVGLLLKDKTVYTKLTLVMNQITGAIEDARESAPVSTFISVLGSSFR